MPTNILIIDDEIENLRLLTQILRENGYIVRPVTNGQTAIAAAKAEAPDLILLDINMPEMDGYEVCETLKKDQSLREIPVIFLTGSDQTVDKIRAFNLGGVDYVTKPFQLEEIKARIETHLTINTQKKELQHKTQKLQEGYAKLQDLEKLRDDLVHMIIHDVRNILQGICGYLDLLQLFRGDISEEKRQEYLRNARELADDLGEMTNSLLEINEIESGELKLNIIAHDFNQLYQRAIKQVEGTLVGRKIALETLISPAYIMCDPKITERVIFNLLHNAIKFTTDHGCITVGIEKVDSMALIYVRDDGPGIPPQFHSKIFDKFGRYTKAISQKKSTGLGLAFCKLAVEAQGGEMGIESVEGKGSKFWFTLPLSP